MLERNEEGWGLKEDHLHYIMRAVYEGGGIDLDYLQLYYEEDTDQFNYVIDAMMASMQQVNERVPGFDQMRSLAAEIADDDERWWINRAAQLGITLERVGDFHNPETPARWRQEEQWKAEWRKAS